MSDQAYRARPAICGLRESASSMTFVWTIDRWARPAHAKRATG